MTREEIDTFCAELVSGYDMEPEDAASLHAICKLAALSSAPPDRRINTHCPSCGMSTLFLDANGHLVCSLIGCKQPVVERAIEALKTAIAPAPPSTPRRHQPACDRAGWDGRSNDPKPVCTCPAPPVAETPTCAACEGEGGYESQGPAGWISQPCGVCAGTGKQQPASPVVAPAPVVETVTVTRENCEQALQWAESSGQRIEVSDSRDLKPDVRARYRTLAARDMAKAREYLKLSPRETPDGGGR